MKLKLDENLPTELAELFREHGHDTHTVLDEALGGATDSTIAEVCRTENRTIVTFDTDFADIRTYVPAEFNGIVVLRLGNQSKEHLLGVAARLLPTLESQPLRGQLWIVEDSQIRIREKSED